jgi:thermitase
MTVERRLLEGDPMPPRSARRLVGFAAAVLMIASTSTAVFARPLLSDPAVTVRLSGVVVQVADAAHMASVRAALESQGAIIDRTYRWNSYVVIPPVGSTPALFAIEAHGIGGVKYAQGTAIMHEMATPAANDPLYSQQWGLPDIGAPAAWAQTEGSGVSIAIIDTGIDATQPDLTGRVVLYKNYVTPGASAADDEGHGTHVAGIAAATRNNGIEGAGTAPKATLYAFKVLDSTGSGDDASVAAAIRDAVDLTPCRIISMSLGGPSGSQTLSSAVAYAESKGAIVIAAAGNDGVTTASYPAAYAGVVGVGAVD